MTQQVVNFHKCDTCKRYTSTSFRNMLYHVTRHILNNNEDSFSCHSRLEPHQCEFCNFETDLKVRLERHVSCLHKQRKIDVYELCLLGCDQCGFRSYSELVLAKHVCSDVNYHYSELGSKWFKCGKCPFMTDSKYSINAHITQHTINKHTNHDHTIAQCSYRPKTQPILIHHVETCECEFCSYRAKEMSNLRRHLKRKHTDLDDITWYWCQQCSYKSKTKRTVEQHTIALHCGTWYKCGYCNFRTKNEISWKQHSMYRHSTVGNITWYTCEYCSYLTRRRRDLTKHIMIKHKVELTMTKPNIVDDLKSVNVQ